MLRFLPLLVFAECLSGVKLITGVSPPAYSVDLLDKDEIHKVFTQVFLIMSCIARKPVFGVSDQV